MQFSATASLRPGHLDARNLASCHKWFLKHNTGYNVWEQDRQRTYESNVEVCSCNHCLSG